MSRSQQATASSLLSRVHHYSYPLQALVKRDVKKRYAATRYNDPAANLVESAADAIEFPGRQRRGDIGRLHFS